MNTHGNGALLRFMLRRERRGLPWWVLGAGLLVFYQSLGSQRLYGTPQELAQLRETMGGNPAVVAMSGPTRLLDTIGGEVVFEIFAFVSVLIALMNMFLVGRHTRADEESGRAELIRSARVGRYAPLAAVLGLAGLANLIVGVVVFAAAAGSGLPVGGAALVAAAAAGVGITFAALTSVAAQVFEGARAVYGAVTLAIGVAFMLRAVGDSGDGTLSWLSPIGWGQRTFPFVDNRWWPLLLPLVTSGLLVAGAVALLDRRDVGAGLLPTRPGRATASPALNSPLALAWRLQRGSLVGWASGLFLLGATYGSFGRSVEQFVADNPEIARFFPGGATSVADSFLALTIVLCALLTAAYGVSSALRARGEESSGRAEPVLAAATSRAAWLASHLSVALAGCAVLLGAAGLGEGLAYGLAVSDAGQVPRLIGVALVHLPATWLIVAVAVLAFGWLPRATAAVAWVAVGYCAVIALFGDSFRLPGWTQQASPFIHTPEAPLEQVTALPLLAVGAVVAVVLAGGFAGFRRRDVG